MKTICIVCYKASQSKANKIIECENCGHRFHQKCHKPRIVSVSKRGQWKCRRCELQLFIKMNAEKRRVSIEKNILKLKKVLPYNSNALHWDSDHFTNTENTYCYCGTPGEYFSKMLRCRRCLQWFHESCIQPLSCPLLYGDHFFSFYCVICNEGEEFVERIRMEVNDLVAITLNSLAMEGEKCFFDLKTDIFPIVRKYCESLIARDEYRKMSDETLIDRIEMILHANQNKFVSSHTFTEKFKNSSPQWALKASPNRKACIFGLKRKQKLFSIQKQLLKSNYKKMDKSQLKPEEMKQTSQVEYSKGNDASRGNGRSEKRPSLSNAVPRAARKFAINANIDLFR